MITIFDRYGNSKAEISPNDSSIQSKEIQADNVLQLSFINYDHILLDVDDNVDFMGERYWLCEKYRPKQKSEHEWEYNLKLYGIESLLKNILVIKRVDNENNPVFTLTAPPREHVAMIVNCLNDGMGNITDWKVGQVDGTENIVIDYFGKYCDEALREIAEKVGAEYWTEGQTVNVCRCEHGEHIALGYDKGLTGIEPDTADNVKFYTRLYPVGSSRNIDPEKYGHSRLQLPDGKKYVEINADKYSRVDHYEESAFADIYPRRIGKISSVRFEEKTGKDGNPFISYYFRDENLPFDPNKYEIPGLVKRVSFQEGSELAGLGAEEDGTYYFEVKFNSDTREFEIITTWPYDDGNQLPGGNLIPKEGDNYILWHIRMPDEYYQLAEEEFRTAVDKYNEDHGLDITVFKASTDHVWIEDNNVDLFVGRRVRLESQKYFPETGYRDSRITKITRKINLPSSMDIEIGDALSRSSKQKFTDDIADAKSYAQSIGSSISMPDIIRTGDRTVPTDNNIFSALRILRDLLRKDQADRTPYQLASDLGFEVGKYLAGVSGGMFGIDNQDKQSFADVFKLFVRGKAYFETLTTIEAQTLAGKYYITPGGTIKCTKVEDVKDAQGDVTAYRCYFLSEQDGEKTETKIIAGDQAISEMFNAKTNTTNKLTNHRYWRLVTAVNNDEYTDDAGNHYGYIDLSATDCMAGSDIPKDGDVIDQLGSRNDATRQSAMVFSTVDPDSPSIKMFAGIGSGTTNAEHYSLDGKAIISFGRNPSTGKVYFRLGATDATEYLEYNQDGGLTLNGKLSVNSTIGGKILKNYFTDLIPDIPDAYDDTEIKEEINKYQYLAKALSQSTTIAGGLLLSTLVELGYTDASGVRHTMAGMNGSWVDSLGGRTIGSWWGGNMIDLFKADGTRKTLQEIIDETGDHNPRPATSLVRMDGSAYWSNGNIRFLNTGTAEFGDTTNGYGITIDPLGKIIMGSGIEINIGGEAQGLADSIASVTNLVNLIGNNLVPTYLTQGGTFAETTWENILSKKHTLAAIKSKVGFFGDSFMSSRGGESGGSGSGSGGGTSYNRLDAWDKYTADKAGYILSAFLGKDLDTRLSAIEGDYAKKSDIPSLARYATQSWVEAKGYLTGLPSRLAQYITWGLSDGNGFGRMAADSPFETLAGSGYDCMLITTAFSDIWRGELALDYRTNNIAYRNKNNGVWNSWALMATTNTAQEISATKTFTAGLRVSGRAFGVGDDEGIVIGKASNGYAALTLGIHTNGRSVLYLDPNDNAFWRWCGGGADNCDIHHPKKSGTIALTSDITASLASALASYLPLTGGSMTNTNVVTNLNADLLDGYHESSFVRSWWTDEPGYDCDTYNVRPLISFTYHNNAPFTGAFIDVNTDGYGFYLGTQYGYDSPLYYRRHGTSADCGMGSWRQLLDATNYSSVLDSRYYTEGEVDSLLSGKVSKNGDAMTGALDLRSYLFLTNPTSGKGLYFNTDESGNVSFSQHVNNAWTGEAFTFSNDGSFLAKSIGVTSDALVSNLNADMLDGVHNGSVTAHLLNYNNAGGVSSAVQFMQKDTGWNEWDSPDQSWRSVIKLCHGNGDTYFNRTLAFDFFSHRIYTGRLQTGDFAGWKTLAFLDDNVASATNADMLDGYHHSDFAHMDQVHGAPGDSDISLLKSAHSRFADSMGRVVRLEHGSYSMAFGWFLGGYPLETAYGGWFVSDYATPRWIGVSYGDWVDETFAFLSSNVASATKLQTARTIWGRPFDGRDNVTGNMESVDNIYMSGYVLNNVNGQYLSVLDYHGDGSLALNYGLATVKGLPCTIYGNTVVKGDLYADGMMQSNASASDSARMRVNCGNTSILTMEANANGRGLYDTTLQKYMWWFDGSNVFTNYDGNYGIGTTSPAYKLDVNGDIITGDGAWLRTRGNTGWYNESYGGGWYMKDSTYIRNYSARRLLIEGIDDYYAVWLSSGGVCTEGYAGTSWNQGYGALNVGIANNDHQTPLLVAYRNGSALEHTGSDRLFSMEFHNSGWLLRFCFGGAEKFEFISNGVFHALGGIYAEGYVSSRGSNSSDERLKTDIRDFRASDIIRTLHPRAFRWNDFARSMFPVFDTDDTQYGLIAQEAKTCHPWLVDENMFGDGYMGVFYDKLIPVLLQGENELFSVTDDHERRIKELEDENRELRNRIEILTA